MKQYQFWLAAAALIFLGVGSLFIIALVQLSTILDVPVAILGSCLWIALGRQSSKVLPLGFWRG